METQLQKNPGTIAFSFSNFVSSGHIFKEVLTVPLFIFHNAVN